MSFVVRPVESGQWPIVAWLWQAFRHDLAAVVQGFPYADGRYQHAALDDYPSPRHHGYLAWAPHPKTGEDAPIGFALVADGSPRHWQLASFFVVPPARRAGIGRRFALDVLSRNTVGWEVAFQHDNLAAGAFWRQVARAAWGSDWTETEVPVAHKPEAPPDHWIRTT